MLNGSPGELGITSILIILSLLVFCVGLGPLDHGVAIFVMVVGSEGQKFRGLLDLAEADAGWKVLAVRVYLQFSYFKHRNILGEASSQISQNNDNAGNCRGKRRAWSWWLRLGY